MKKIYSAFCVSVLLSFGVAHAGSFSDVPESSSYYTILESLKSKGVIEGYTDGTFHPEKSINRAEALKMLYVGYKKATENAAMPPFSDLSKGAWYMPYVSHAYAKGYVKGYPNGTFAPGNSIKFVELLKILMTVGGIATPTQSDPDYATYGIDQKQWYAPYVLFAFKKSIIDAQVSSEVALEQDATRGMVAEMLYRVLYISENGLSSFPAYEGGQLSYYADSLEGNATASGEKYNPEYFTASHPSMAFGTWVSVVSESTKKSTVVKINDRGPARKGGIADLSSVAFASIDSLSAGVVTGRLYKITSTLGASQVKQSYGTSDILGLTFEDEIPNIVQPGEILQLHATTSAGVTSATIVVKKGSTVISTKKVSAENTKLPLQAYFPAEGTYSLTITTNIGSSKTYTITSAIVKNKALASAPTNVPKVATREVDGGVAVDWESGDLEQTTHVIVEQTGTKAEFITSSSHGIEITSDMASEIDFTLPYVVQVHIANRSTVFSHDVYSAYKDIGALFVGDSSTGAVSSSLLGNVEGASDVEKIVMLTNADRLKKNVPVVAFSSSLSKLAQHKAEDMAARSYFDHMDPDGKYVNDWKGDFSYLPQISENIAYATQNSVDDVYMGWHNSPGHYANIMDEGSELIGVGIAQGSDRWYYVQHFSAKPLSSDLNSVLTTSLSDIKALGVTLVRNLTLEEIAQDWAVYLAKIGKMSFTIEGEKLGDVVKASGLTGGFHFFVFELTNIKELPEKIISDLKDISNIQDVGIGVAQGQDGWVRVGVIVRNK